MRIKVFLDNKKGSTRLMDDYLDLVRGLVDKYPNAIWRKLQPKNGQIGYELKI